MAGAHRIEAAYRLGWQTIAAYVLAEDDENPEHAANEDCLWEIAENLHRAELSADQRGEHFARWLQLRGEIPPSKADVLAAWEKAEPAMKWAVFPPPHVSLIHLGIPTAMINCRNFRQFLSEG